uniref:Uncharacterized protein n=1 Tax=Ditylenchus dipsaci TaxID=166011 RepID=A0A915EHG6_9BILA
MFDRILSLSHVEKSHLEHSQCDFPAHLLGEYGDGRLTVSSSQIQDKQNEGSSPSVVSVCVSLDDKTSGERILVHSTTSCGDPLGFHCLWFRPRSESVLEFKTTPTVSEPSQTMCSNDHEFELVPWTTLASNKPQKSLCGFFGQYSTPREMWLGGDCYSLSVDCDQLNSFKLVAFHCQTGEAYDARTYSCLGTWKEGELMFVYTQTGSTSTSINKKTELFCFISQQHDGNLFVAPVGSHCERDFNFTANSDKTIVLNQQQYCRSNVGSGDLQPKTKTENKDGLQQIQHSPVVSEYERTGNTNNKAHNSNEKSMNFMIMVALFLFFKLNY